MRGITALQRHALKVFYNVQKFQQECGAILKVLVAVQKHLLKLIVKSTSKIQKSFKTLNMKKFHSK